MSRNLFRAIVLLAACFSIFFPTTFAHAQTAYAVTGSNQLVRFNLATPGTFSASMPITGLGGGEVVLSMDFRPATGELYVLGSLSRLYLVNPATGAATQVGAPGGFTLTGAGSGTSFGFDFNPTVDRIRVVSDAEQNLRLNPATGALAAADSALAYAIGDVNAGANPGVTASAYTNNVAGATTTTLYGIDTSLDVLVIQNPPNGGALNTVGALGVNAGNLAAFDIVSAGGVDIGYAALQVGGPALPSGLYRINLATGAATLVGPVGGGAILVALAIVPDTPRLSNISTRGHVLTGSSVMIAGFVIEGVGPQALAIVVTGPSLAAYGITNPLPNPRLTLVRSSDQAVLATNDDWQTDPNATALQASGFAPPNAQEAALLTTLMPGAYTVIVEGTGGTTGIAVVGVYRVQ